MRSPQQRVTVSIGKQYHQLLDNLSQIEGRPKTTQLEQLIVQGAKDHGIRVPKNIYLKSA